MSTLRTVAPGYDNKYYKSSAYGGVNDCLRITGSSCIPNCVGYAWGAWYEMMGVKPKLSRANAKNWYGYTSDGYERSKTPELGAVACWGGGKYGHVAIVVGIHSDHITVAQSNYGGTRWELVNCYKMSNGLYRSHAGNTNMQGFILLPQGYKVVIPKPSTTASSGKVTTWNLSKRFAKGKKFIVQNTNGKGLCMRSYPSTSGKIIETIAENHAVYYFGRGAMNGNVCWYWVHDYSTGKEGYVYGGVHNSNKAPYLKNARP